MSIQALAFWLIAAGVLLAPVTAAVYLYLGAAAFGALATLPADMVGRANILPQSIAAVILVVKVFAEPRRRRIIARAACDLRGYGLETLFVVAALIAAYALPRMFEGQVFTISMNMNMSTPQPLEPTLSNLAQSVYLLLNFAVGLALMAYALDGDHAKRREHLLLALLTGGAILALSGILDAVGGFYSPLKDFVAGFKTAGYDLYLDSSIGDVHRITGFFSEASGFGVPAVGVGALLYYVRPAIASRLAREVICPIVSLLLIALAALSTSTTAYAGLAVFGVTWLLRLIYRLFRRGGFKGLEIDVCLAAVATVALIAVLVFAPDLTRRPMAVLEEMVLRKSHSQSFIERNSWNITALQAFFDTYGLGVGPGGARTSNWLVSLLSNTGALGFVLMMAFISQRLMQRPLPGSRRAAQLAAGVKLAFPAYLATEVASGTTVDPGFLLATSMALMVAASARAAAYVEPPARRQKFNSAALIQPAGAMAKV